MPLFTSASGVQINGGSFIDIAGDVNLHNMQPTMAQNSDLWSASRQLSGVERNSQNGAARLVPHDASRRLQILSSSGRIRQEESWSNSAASIQSVLNLSPFTSSQPEYSPSFEPGRIETVHSIPLPDIMFPLMAHSLSTPP
ncbi:hypothetical protein B0H13DRAFT_1869794 [Mycena leptocephala]|nr:hypothetical protein B0H13DRAFT_1869794 [Mycena leptocephala]